VQGVIERFAAFDGDQAGALWIDAAPTSAPGHLREFPHAQRAEAIVGALAEVLDNYAFGGHVDPQAHGLSGKDYLDQASFEEDLSQTLERREHAGVVNAHSLSQTLEDQAIQLAVSGNAWVIDQRFVDCRLDFVCSTRIDEADAIPEAAAQGRFAAGATEDKVNRRQPVSGSQLDDQATCVQPAAPVMMPRRALFLQQRMAVLEHLIGRHDSSMWIDQKVV